MATNRTENRGVGPAADAAGRAMQCMEVWGGNRAIDNAVSMPGLDAWIYSLPFRGEARGGDIHYLSSCATGRISRLLVADVSGHGAAVGELAHRLRRLMARHANFLDQTRFVESLNKQFADLAGGGSFATAVVATYWAPTDSLVTCNAGHPRPLWWSERRREWRLLTAESAGVDVSKKAEAGRGELRNLPLGVADPTRYEQFGVRLREGDLVLIYTDSLIEAAGPDGRQLGERGLLELVKRLDLERPETIVRSLLEAVGAHRGGAPASDDVTVLLLRHNGSRPARLGVRGWLRAWRRFTALAVASLRRGGDPAPWPETRVETVGGVFWRRLGERWRAGPDGGERG